MAIWYVQRADGAHEGPLETEAVAEAVLAGRLSETALIAAPGGDRWVRAIDVPVVARAVSGAETPRLVPHAVAARALASTVVAEGAVLRVVAGTTRDDGALDYGATVMMVAEGEIELVDERDAPTPRAANRPPPRLSGTVPIDPRALGVPERDPNATPPTLPDVTSVIPPAEETSPALFEPGADANQTTPDAAPLGARVRREVDMAETCFFPDGVPSSVDVRARRP